MEDINLYLNKTSKKYYDRNYKFTNLANVASTTKNKGSENIINNFLSTQQANYNRLSANKYSSGSSNKQYNKLIDKIVNQSSKNVPIVKAVIPGVCIL